MIKAFIFDFDGLIIDTETSCYQSWEGIYKRFDVDLPLEEWIKCVGSSNSQFNPIQYLKSKTNKKFMGNELEKEQLNNHYNNSLNAPILPGVMTYLNFAKKNHLKLAIASSSPYWWVSQHLQKKNILNMFDEIISSDDVNHVKPAPDLFLKAKEKLQISDYQGLVFEDSEHGIHAAFSAKLYCVAVPNPITRYSDFNKANIVINSLDRENPSALLKSLENHQFDD